MPTLSNARHERFAVNYAGGMAATIAHAEAGYSENRGNACRLKANEHVKARIVEIQEEKAKAAQLSRNDILAMIAADRDLARAEAQSSAALRACELLGRELHGMFVERRDITTRDDTRELDSEQLGAALLATAKALGLTGAALREIEEQVASLAPGTDRSADRLSSAPGTDRSAESD